MDDGVYPNNFNINSLSEVDFRNLSRSQQIFFLGEPNNNLSSFFSVHSNQLNLKKSWRKWRKRPNIILIFICSKSKYSF